MQSEYEGYYLEEVADGKVYVYDSLEAWRNRKHIVIAQDEYWAKDWIDKELTKSQLEEAISKLGGSKPAYQWFGEGQLPSYFYHLTSKDRVDSILRYGLSSTSEATQFSPSTRYGTYLFVSKGDLDHFSDVLTYEMYKGQRKWIDLAVMRIAIPSSWLLVIDPEYVEDPENPYAFISPESIPASMVALDEERPASEAKKWYEEHRPD